MRPALPLGEARTLAISVATLTAMKAAAEASLLVILQQPSNRAALKSYQNGDRGGAVAGIEEAQGYWKIIEDIDAELERAAGTRKRFRTFGMVAP